MGDMQQEIAYRFAATAVEGVSLAQAKEIIDTYTLSLATCQTCNNTGEVEYIQTGVAKTECEVCGTRKSEAPRGDGRYSEWKCLLRNGIDHCRAVADGRVEPDDGADHAACGPVVRLPVSLARMREGLS